MASTARPEMEHQNTEPSLRFIWYSVSTAPPARMRLVELTPEPLAGLRGHVQHLHVAAVQFIGSVAEHLQKQGVGRRDLGPGVEHHDAHCAVVKDGVLPGEGIADEPGGFAGAMLRHVEACDHQGQQKGQCDRRHARGGYRAGPGVVVDVYAQHRQDHVALEVPDGYETGHPGAPLVGIGTHDLTVCPFRARTEGRPAPRRTPDPGDRSPSRPPGCRPRRRPGRPS